MKQLFSENKILIIAFSLPLLLIVVVGVSAVLPSRLLQTGYDFVYAACDVGSGYSNRHLASCGEYLQQRFTVEDGKLLTHEVTEMTYDNGRLVPASFVARLFLHNTKTNESREITLEEAESLDLSALLTSPDRVAFAWESDRAVDMFFIFGSRSDYGYYLKRGNSKRKLELIQISDRYYYGDTLKFIGWVLPERSN